MATPPSSPPTLSVDDGLRSSSADLPEAPLTWQQLVTGDGLPDSDRQLIRQCRSRAVIYGLVGAVAAGGCMGGLVYGRGLLTPSRRYAATLASTVWGVAAGVVLSSPSCLQSMASSRDSHSVLRREMARVIVRHNPNHAAELVRRENGLRVAREQLEQPQH